ncbi:hypothetical protein [Haloplanus litoreus]
MSVDEAVEGERTPADPFRNDGRLAAHVDAARLATGSVRRVD